MARTGSEPQPRPRRARLAVAGALLGLIESTDGGGTWELLYRDPDP